jgi:hypothetical protein
MLLNNIIIRDVIELEKEFRVAVIIVAVSLFVSGVALSFCDKVEATVATYAAGILCLIFVFLPEFKKFKGLGIEAELLNRKIAEADLLLAQLREMAATGHIAVNEGRGCEQEKG